MFQKGEEIFLLGEQPKALYEIISGCVRGYFLDESGNDFTKCFSVEGDFFGTQSYRTGKNATYAIQALEETKARKIPYAVIDELRSKNPKFNAFIEEQLEEELERTEEQMRLYLVSDAKARLETFQLSQPDLYQRLKLETIASYIGVRPSSLSRLLKT
ncbi:Crp/Fnr family transcriptional regulator [Lactococcus termiticola]